jgi:Tol biopolymer transport system component
MRRTCTVALLTLVSLLAAQQAQAGFPGRNGRIAYTRDGQIATINPNGSGRVTLTHIKHGHCEAPAFSANGNRIVFDAKKGGSFDIFSMKTDGTDLRRLTTDSLYEWAPSWTPNGSQIIYTRGAGNDGELWTMDPDGTHQQMLISGGNNEWARYSPNGKQLVFSSDRRDPGDYDLYLAKANGTKVHIITTVAGVQDFPEWRPDGAFVSFTSNYYSGPGDASDVERMTTQPTSDPATWSHLITTKNVRYNAAWSPDRKYLVADLGGKVTRVTVSTGARKTLARQDGFGVDWQPL